MPCVARWRVSCESSERAATGDCRAGITSSRRTGRLVLHKGEAGISCHRGHTRYPGGVVGPIEALAYVAFNTLSHDRTAQDQPAGDSRNL